MMPTDQSLLERSAQWHLERRDELLHSVTLANGRSDDYKDGWADEIQRWKEEAESHEQMAAACTRAAQALSTKPAEEVQK